MLCLHVATKGYWELRLAWLLKPVICAELLAASVLPKAMNSPKAAGLKRRHATRGLDHVQPFKAGSLVLTH